MDTHDQAAPAKVLGFWSTALAFVFSVTYGIAQLAEWFGWLGSAGGPESSSTPLGILVLLTPSLFLGPCFLLAMLGVDGIAPPSHKVFGHAAIAFATVYLVMISINYYVQLTWVMPRLSADRITGMEPFLFVPFDSFLYAVDILGYGFMSIAAFFAAMALAGDPAAKRARWFLFATAALLPFITLQMYWHWMIWIAAAWAVTFPAAMWSLARRFRIMSPQPSVPLAAPVPGQ